jgi:hypothetical protein
VPLTNCSLEPPPSRGSDQMARRRLGRHTVPRGVLLSCGSPALSVRRLGRIQRSGSAARDRQKTRRQSRQRLLDPECQFDNQCQQQRCGQGHRSSQLYREPIGCFWMTHCEAPKFATTSKFRISQHRDRAAGHVVARRLPRDVDYSTQRICQLRPGSRMILVTQALSPRRKSRQRASMSQRGAFHTQASN